MPVTVMPRVQRSVMMHGHARIVWAPVAVVLTVPFHFVASTRSRVRGMAPGVGLSGSPPGRDVTMSARTPQTWVEGCVTVTVTLIAPTGTGAVPSGWLMVQMPVIIAIDAPAWPIFEWAACCGASFDFEADFFFWGAGLRGAGLRAGFFAAGFFVGFLTGFFFLAMRSPKGYGFAGG